MGGASGHMPHPFDLETVKSGEDLINLFYSIQNFINTSVIKENINVKIDGSNLSFKVVGNEFAVDRGTQKAIDVEGITLNRIHERYDPSYQVYSDIEELLLILNSSFFDIQEELKDLGMLKDNTIFLNTEFVSKTNVIDYPYNFIAIHGVSQFYEKHKKVKGGKYIKTRPGISNPKSSNKAISKEIRYNEDTLARLVEKIRPYAEKRGMKVFGPIPAIKKKECLIEKALNKKLRITTEIKTPFLNSNNGKTLKDWLNAIVELPAYYCHNNKRYMTMVENNKGKKINPYHKKTYYQIIEENTPINSLISVQDIDKVAAGIAILHATRIVGQSILESMTSWVGPVVEHEGVVIRKQSFSEHPFKITGEYLVKGMFGYIAKDLASRQ